MKSILFGVKMSSLHLVLYVVACSGKFRDWIFCLYRRRDNNTDII